MALVIGYGNPLRADDGVGWQVAQRLAGDVSTDVEVISTHQLTPELAKPIGRARLVVFVDARAGGEPGSIDCRLAGPAGGGTVMFSHDLDPPALLELARLVYGACPTAVVVSIAGADFGYGVGLSLAVQAAIPEAVRRVCALLVEEKASCMS
jgi:hydrogenase maturation protease